MEFEFTNNPLNKISADAIVVFAFQNEKGKVKKIIPLESFSATDKVLKGALEKAAETSGFEAKRGEILNYFPQNGFLSQWIVALGLGKKSDFIADDLRRASGLFAGRMKKKIQSVAMILPDVKELPLTGELISQAIAEGLLLGSYEFDKYRTKEEKGERDLSTVIISNTGGSAVKQGIERAKIYAEGTILARDLVNEPAAIATPTYLADLALSIAKKDKNITCKVFGREEAEKMGMGAFLGIASASDTEPKFIHLEYNPGNQSGREKLAVIGKGITFDSGGINVKPGDHMQDMKMDMSGAAIVLGVFSVISRIKPKFPVLGIIAATPNLISGKSIVPGDVVRALNGKTIEVLNTDAEGRVTMADSLSYAVNQKATRIIDFATLTGACMVALGTDITGLFSNNRDFAESIKRAAFEAGEKVWELPLEKDYKDMNKSEVADIANIPNSRYGGALTAALFLEEFVDGKAWAHMDIAGPAFSAKTNDTGPKGGTGHGVRTVLNLLS